MAWLPLHLQEITHMERFRHFLSALWLTATGLTLAQINALLGFISLLIGISYQLWKWKREASKD